ncbi:MAG: CBS domain-containing protein [Bacteroidetes bacterium]|nr:CBS domain-containing protein [Bacteroidota bacterium]MBK8681506.1 CBS domain-containing protein [Bacteroidota bacterium]MBP9796877.1 CBS domain-containing protein [Chitinophagales bacterium]
MGIQVEGNISRQVRHKFIHQLLEDVEALEYMVDHDLFEADTWRIGAEQELCIVNEDWKPAPDAMKILADANDPYITTELATYNLEINLDPLRLQHNCFSLIQQQLEEKLLVLKNAAAKYNDKIVIAGILPSITRNELTLEYLTPLKRYEHLNGALLKARGLKFDLFLKGLDEIHVRHDNILFEACNTSFQCHLQLHPKDFAIAYNWALAISGPVLAAATNSPLLLGKELWSEIRIALFQQAIDTRKTIDEIRERKGRVTFGENWIKNSITEVYKNNIANYHPLLFMEHEEYAMKKLKQGEVPELFSLRMHNGTVYSWNRLCYGISNGKPHMRLENRYIPAGPTVQDEIANMVFWTGLMINPPAEAFDIWNHFDFKDVKSNFFKAARTGVESVLIWKGKEISTKQLIEQELLPLAFIGLRKAGIDEADIIKYLGIIERRLKTHTGAQWQVNNYRKLREVMGQSDAVISLTQNIYERQQEKNAVCDWKPIDTKKSVTERYSKMVYVKQLMSTNLITVFPEDLLQLVNYIMQWQKIGHMLIEDKKGKLVGLVTANSVIEYMQEHGSLNKITVDRIMKKKVITISPEDTIKNALNLMQTNSITSLPVVSDDILVGIVTRKDMLWWLSMIKT